MRSVGDRGLAAWRRFALGLPARRFGAACLAAWGLFGSALADGGEAAASTDLVFGQSAALTGPASELGSGMRQGLLAAFGEANRRGGVDGRQLSLVTLDDAYEPEAAIANTRRLIEEIQALALIGAVGTPTSRAAQPVAAEAGVPTSLRSPALSSCGRRSSVPT